METEDKSKNNNQNFNMQAAPSTSHGFRTDRTHNVYICMPRSNSSHPIRSMCQYQKRKNNGRLNGSFRQAALALGGTFYQNIARNVTEEPIDLTCSEKRTNDDCNIKTEPASQKHNSANLEYDNLEEFNASETGDSQNDFTLNGSAIKRLLSLQIPTLEPGTLKTLVEASDLLQTADNRQAEVLKAAKSLFSKRTRTLFHWLYPNAPKPQLKAAVATTWETLGEQEKEFYISQVLGRFGFPQTNLMVNPQLGGLAGYISPPQVDLTRSTEEAHEETSTAVSSLLFSQPESTSGGSWVHPNVSAFSSSSTPYTQRTNKHRKRLGRPPGSKNKKPTKEESPLLNQIREDAPGDEFQDDPELSREFEQFRWTLHLNDDTKI